MRHIRRWGLIVAPLCVLFLSMAALTHASPARQTGVTPPANQCSTATYKSVEPGEIILGQSADVTMVFTQTCVAKRAPIDIVILADESNSMTRAEDRGGRLPTPGATLDPRVTPPVERTPEPSATPGSGNPGGGGGPGVGRDNTEPPGCIETPPGGGGIRPTLEPKATPTEKLPPPPLVNDGAPLQDPFPTRTTEPRPQPGIPVPTREPGGSDLTDPEPAGSEDLLREVSIFMRDFVNDPAISGDIESGVLRLGFAAFGSRGRTILTLHDGELGKKVGSSGNRLKGEGLSRIDLGLRVAETELNKRPRSAEGEPVRRKVILILSDGGFCSRDLNRAKVGRDIEVVTVFIGRGGWKRRLDQLATDGRYKFTQRELKQLIGLYQSTLAVTVPTNMDQLLIRDTLAPEMALVDGSPSPALSVRKDPHMEWWGVHPTLPLTTTDWHWAHSVISPATGIKVTDLVTVSERMTLTYTVRPLEAGTLPISQDAWAAWHESSGIDGNMLFPSAYIDVLAPTATPTNTPTTTPTSTSTPTPTATNTPTPEARYFPIALNRWPEPLPTATPDPCPPELQRVDIALVVDASTSMSGTAGGTQTKLQAAIVAAKTLAGLLQLQSDGLSDQATVIAFSRTATVLAELTGDRPTVDAALDRLPSLQGTGTHIDEALQAALDELNSARRRPGSTRSLVLVTDGVNNGDRARVVALAAQLRAADIAVFTVGLGSDVDAVLLREVATTPDNFRQAPTTDDLELIYREIAALIPCPRDRP